MSFCKICRKPVKSGVVVHSECYEELNNFDNTQSKLLLIKISELREENAELKARVQQEVKYCKNTSVSNPVDGFECSECGLILEDWVRVEIDEHDMDKSHCEYEFDYCPNCGSRVRE